MARLPQPGGDSGNWGAILNDFLSQTHKSDGTLKDDTVTASAIADGTITEPLLDSSLQTKLNTTTPDATSTTAGKVRLTGDLAGTAANPTVPGLTQKVAKGELVINVKDYGAKGDGVTDDSSALQAAFNAQAASSNPTGGKPAIYFPAGKYITSTTIVAGAGGYFTIRGNSVKSTYIVGSAALSGYVIEARAGFDVSDITINGNNKDGTYCFGYAGSTAINFSPTKMERVNLSEADYLVRFAGQSQFPVKAVFKDIYAYQFRTCGIMVALGGTTWANVSVTDNGQSAWTFDNVLVTNGGGAAGVPLNASGLAVTADSPDTTHDALSWDGGDDTEVGYTIMRRVQGSTDGFAWTWVATVNTGTHTYSASKTAGTYYDYKVYRNSIGLYCRWGKAIACNALQVERCGRGAWFENCRGVSVNGFYYEWRGGVQADPGPIGDALTFSNSIGCHVNDGYVQYVVSAVTNRFSKLVSVDGITVPNCQRSGVHIQTTDATQTTKVGLINVQSGMSKITTDGATTSHHYSSINPTVTDETTVNRHVVNHPAVAEIQANYQGSQRATLGGDATSGYLNLLSAALPTASATYFGQVRRYQGKLWICVDQGAGYTWYPLMRTTELSTAQIELIGGARTDGSQAATFGYDGSGQPTASPNLSTKNFLVTRGGVQLGSSGPVWRSGTGSPEGVLTAVAGSLYTRTDGGAGTTLYVKESGTGNTGWTAK